MHRYSSALYPGLELITIQPVGWHGCGGIRLAKTTDEIERFRNIAGLFGQCRVPRGGEWLATLPARSLAIPCWREATFATVLERAERILGQQPGDKGKLFALHAPEVECIGKGKARARYEVSAR